MVAGMYVSSDPSDTTLSYMLGLAGRSLARHHECEGIYAIRRLKQDRELELMTQETSN